MEENLTTVSVKMEVYPPVKEKLMTRIGFKEAESKTHEIFRLILIWGITYLIYMAVRSKDTTPVVSIDVLSDRIKPGTLVYKALLQMDNDTRTECINALKSAFDSKRRATKKILRAIRVGLLAGLLTEFIVNGNTDKPVSVVARTITYSTLVALFG